jgi:hypothetical protein
MHRDQIGLTGAAVSAGPELDDPRWLFAGALRKNSHVTEGLAGRVHSLGRVETLVDGLIG